jgi:hypothetical protein
MCGGGGAPRAPDPMKQAEAEIKLLQQQYDLEERQALAALEREKAQEAEDRAQWQTDLGAGRSRAQTAIGQQFERAGLSADDYMDRITAALDLAQSGMTYGQSPTFGTGLGEQILGDIRSSQIKDYQRAINEYAPEGFTQNAFASTADDAIINAILGEQFGTASDAILRARDRGTLNDAGFKYAMDNLNTQKQAAMARLQDTGGGILEGYRGSLDDIVKNARTGAGSWDFGDTFDPNVYRTQLETKQGELGSRLEGDIRNAIGGEQFFNTADLIQKGGVGQGATNTGLGGQSGGLLAAITQRKTDEEQQRGLGTQGSF